MEAAEELAGRIGQTAEACEALGVARCTLYRRRQPGHAQTEASSSGRTEPSTRPSARRSSAPCTVSGSSTRRPPRCGPRFWTREPTSARFARCIGFWRSTARSGSAGTNGAIRTTPSRSCCPKRPTRFGRGILRELRGPVKWTYYYLYVILNIFSRYVVGWMLAHRESAALAQRLIAESCRKQDIEPDQLTLHADRGSSMRSKPVGLLLADLGVTKTHSRPYVSNDNPYSESQFKTMKYCPQFPSHFGSAEDGRLFCCGFFDYYNFHHRHSGIGLMTPADVHYGRAEQLTTARRQILLEAQQAHPERFVRGTPQPPVLPPQAWINPPAGKNDAPRCRTSPSRGGVHTWGYPLFLLHATRSWSMLTSIAPTSRVSPP